MPKSEKKNRKPIVEFCKEKKDELKNKLAKLIESGIRFSITIYEWTSNISIRSQCNSSLIPQLLQNEPDFNNRYCYTFKVQFLTEKKLKEFGLDLQSINWYLLKMVQAL
ncbi:hypothetical protein DMUE_4751 [Dictyocoela muelleri]|nr:hypothetical protein DMUE_4751 [Dictyocoela muelleri]